MSNINKIRQEIEKQRGFIEGLFIEGDNNFYDGQDDAYNHLLAFIDSLPEEKLSYVTDSPGDPGDPGEPGMSDLEVAAQEYADGEMMSGLAERAFIDGAKWQKEQMMKEAVEAEITAGRLPDDWSLAYNPDELHRALLKFKSGDKVKIIIVKQ